MKKLMKKKVNMFGKSVPVFLIVMVAMAGFASAALVGYLSLPITGQVIVNSPLEMKFEGEAYNEVLTKEFGTIHGGETFTYKTWTKNDGVNDIYSYPITTMISTYNWTGDEFTEVTFEDPNHAGSPFSILGMLYVVDDNGDLKKFVDKNWVTDGSVADKKTLKLFFDNSPVNGSQKYNHPALSEDWINIVVTTNLVIAPDTYTIKLCHLNDIEESCVI